MARRFPDLDEILWNLPRYLFGEVANPVGVLLVWVWRLIVIAGVVFVAAAQWSALLHQVAGG